MDFGPAPATKSRKNLWLIVVLVLFLVIAGTAVGWAHWHQPKKPAQAPFVPASISQAVDFPVYYPEQAKLPAGYTLDKGSFSSPVKNGVTYSVSYGANKKIVFSLQTKPSDNELQSFNSNYIPLRNDYQTPNGQAEIGAYNNHGTLETLASLPVSNGPWIIMTAPQDIDQNQLKQVIASLRR